MITTFKLAGFIAAHATLCLSESDSLSSLLAFAAGDGQRNLERLVFEDLGAAIVYGRQRLDDLASTCSDGVLAYTGSTIANGIDYPAILLELRHYGLPEARATIAVPYRPRSSGLFRIEIPRVTEWQNCGDYSAEAAMRSFFEGVSSHPEATPVWEAALDGRNARLNASASQCCERLPAFDRSRVQQLLKEKPASPLTAGQISAKAHSRWSKKENADAALLFCVACQRAAEEFASGRNPVDQSPNAFVRAALCFNEAGAQDIAEPMLIEVTNFKWIAFGLPNDSHMTERAYGVLLQNRRSGPCDAFLGLFDEATARCKELGWAFPLTHPLQEELLTIALELDDVRLVRSLAERIAGRQPVSREAKALLKRAKSYLLEKCP